MTPTQIRNRNWQNLRQSLNTLQLAVLDAYRAHGPATTRQISAASHINLLTLRPRTTELFEMGLIKLAGRSGKEGVYRLATIAELKARPSPPASGQLTLI